MFTHAVPCLCYNARTMDKIALKELYAPIVGELEGVRTLVDRLWRDAFSLVGVRQDNIPSLGGKMLRPALTLLSAGAVGVQDLASQEKLAAAFETLHVASLAHDDVIDHAALRRGHNSLNALWDNHAAVLGGDFLVANAVEMVADYGVCAVVTMAVRSVRRMAECELHFFGRLPGDVTREDCVLLARGKTASLFAVACAAPACVAGSPHEKALYDFGESLGVAFQIIDDILDLTESDASLGKPSCGDVVEGKATLPLLYLREALDESGQKRLDGLRGGELKDSDRAWVRESLDRTGAVARALEDANLFQNGAISALNTLPESVYKQSILGLAEFVLQRNH